MCALELNRENYYKYTGVDDVVIHSCTTVKEIHRIIRNEIKRRAPLLPSSKKARILLKPNLNSDMNALTGNTTDLRVVSGVIKSLQKLGYHNLIVADGTSVGFYHNDINVLERLRITRLARAFDVTVMDLNQSPEVNVDFKGGFEAKIARICLDADFFINLSKLKTHSEAQMSVCLKNLIGCIKGMDKLKVHANLSRNILKLNEKIKPDLHIVDGLFAMEGLGPSAGIPRHVGLLIFGSNPFKLDLLCSKIAGFEWRDVPYLNIAYQNGLLNVKDVERLYQSLKIKENLAKPKNNILASVLFHPKLRNFFVNMRFTPLFDVLVSKDSISKLLRTVKLRQDIIINEDDEVEKIEADAVEYAKTFQICEDLCPMTLKMPHQIGDHKAGCIDCLYCFFVCSNNAIHIKGKLGFLEEHIKWFRPFIRNRALARKYS